jgi:flavorubredoxin
LSHDDSDHVGGLFDVLEQCPKATLLAELFSVMRLSTNRPVPLNRLHILNRGQAFSAGDRQLAAVVPPVFDNQTTRGLYDPTTGVYWAADAFAIESTRAIDDIEELPDPEFREAFLQAQRLMSPWARLLDPTKYEAHLATVRGLRPTVAVGAHGPGFRGAQIESAFRLLEELPYLPGAHLAQQSDLERMIRAMGDESHQSTKP